MLVQRASAPSAAGGAWIDAEGVEIQRAPSWVCVHGAMFSAIPSCFFFFPKQLQGQFLEEGAVAARCPQLCRFAFWQKVDS